LKTFKGARFLLIVLTGVSLLFLLTAQKRQFHRESPYFNKIANDKPTSALLNINNISYWQYNDGRSGTNPRGNSGVKYPRGTAGVIYQDGIVWGGITQDPTSPQLRVGGQTYSIGTQAGRIISPGIAEDTDLPYVRIYKIRSDYLAVSDAELQVEAAELFHDGQIGEVTSEEILKLREQYDKDWKEWPAQHGAPYYDFNKNGIYEADLGEMPGLQNAHQVIWYVCNDLDGGRTFGFYGSPPLGIEMQVTIWGYREPEPLGECAFRRVRLINKSGFQIDSMYMAHWADCDIGDFSDDLVGCDSLLDIGFAYNGYSTDSEFQNFNLPPAAIAYAMLQGPVVTGQIGKDLNRNGVEDSTDDTGNKVASGIYVYQLRAGTFVKANKMVLVR
jgi:hypothetical protein